MSKRAIARHFGISRDSVDKMIVYAVPPGYRRTAPVKRPKLDGFTEIIDQWLSEDNGRPGKQRHTAKRVLDRLRNEHGFTGGYTIVKAYMREHQRRSREMFVPLDHRPGHAQADFGEALVVIGGVEQKAHFFAFDLPHSDACYVRAYPAATAEAWVDGHVHAFAFFGRVPLSVLYDNDRCLVVRILPDGTRKRARLFSGFPKQEGDTVELPLGAQFLYRADHGIDQTEPDAGHRVVPLAKNDQGNADGEEDVVEEAEKVGADDGRIRPACGDPESISFPALAAQGGFRVA